MFDEFIYELLDGIITMIDERMYLFNRGVDIEHDLVDSILIKFGG